MKDSNENIEFLKEEQLKLIGLLGKFEYEKTIIENKIQIIKNKIIDLNELIERNI